MRPWGRRKDHSFSCFGKPHKEKRFDVQSTCLKAVTCDCSVMSIVQYVCTCGDQLGVIIDPVGKVPRIQPEKFLFRIITKMLLIFA